MAIELRTLWKHTKSFDHYEKIKRQRALKIILAKHGINAGLNVAAFTLGKETHTSKTGKTNLWIDGVAIGAFGIADIVEDKEASMKIATVGYLAVDAGLVTGGLAIAGYTRQLFASKSET